MIRAILRSASKSANRLFSTTAVVESAPAITTKFPNLHNFKNTSQQIVSAKPVTPETYNTLNIRGTLDYVMGKKRPGVLALKKGMMTLHDEQGVAHPVTCLQIDRCQAMSTRVIDPVGDKKAMQVIMKRRTRAMHVIEVGMGRKSARQLSIKRLEHFNKLGIPPKRYVRGFSVEADCEIPPGHHFRAAHFVPGQFVDVQAKRYPLD
jgi:hypothetical protein